MGIGAAVAGLIGLAKTSLAYAVVAAIVEAAISAAISYGLSALTSEGGGFDDQTRGDLASGAQLKMTKSTDAVLPLLYGTCRVSINQVFTGISGTDNKYLHIIGTVGEGPINGIKQVGGVDQLFLDDRIYTDFGGEVYYEFFTGTSTQAVCSTLNSAISTWTDPLHYTAYIYLRLEWNDEKFNSLPNVTMIVEGLKLFNPVTEVTAFSNNPALCAYDVLTRPSTRGGYGLDTWQALVSDPVINIDSISEAIDYCTDKGWACNLPLVAKIPVSDNLVKILTTMRGVVLQSENEIKILFLDMNYEAVVMDIDDSDIICNGDESSLTVRQPNVFERPNAIRVKYLNEDGNVDGSGTYQAADFVYTDEAALTQDGDLRETTVELHGVTNLDNVQKMAYYRLERLRANVTISLSVGSKAMALEPMDLIQITSTYTGWSQKIFRVITANYNESSTVDITAIEEDITLYDDQYNPSSAQWYTTIIPNILGAVASVQSVSHAEEVYYYRSRSFTRWKIDFSPPSQAIYPWWDYAEIWVSIGGNSDYRYMTKSTLQYILDPVNEGETYYVKIRSVSVSGAKEDLSSCYTVSTIIIGKTTTPTNLSAMTAVANGDSVSIYSTPITDPDVEGYEVRLGDAWVGGIFISFDKNCSLRLVGVRPGTHTFWMSPKDNAGNYSDTPVSATVTVFVPPGFTELPTYGSWSEDFTSGSFVNAEHDTYDGEDVLKCSHTAGVLVGTWTSTVYDLGALEMVRLWGDFRTSFESSDTTWNGVAPAGTTLTDLDLSRRWSEIFQPSQAGKISARLYHSTDNLDWTNFFDFFEILCCEVQTRYVKVQVTITDPTIDSNLYLRELNLWAFTGPGVV